MTASDTPLTSDNDTVSCENENGRRGATNTRDGLTHPVRDLDTTGRALMSQSQRTPAMDRARTLNPQVIAPFLEVFEQNVVPDAWDRCWEWQGSRLATGYGRCSRSVDGLKVVLYAHRIAWVRYTGTTLPGSTTIDHLCGNTSCVNPEHLEPVSNAENVSRMRARVAPAKTPDEVKQAKRDRARAVYAAAPEEARAAKAKRKPCPICGCSYPSRNLARHVRTHGENR